MADRITGVVAVAFGTLLLILTLRLPVSMLGDPTGHRLLPLALAVVLVGLGLLLAVRGGGRRAPGAGGAAAAAVGPASAGPASTPGPASASGAASGAQTERAGSPPLAAGAGCGMPRREGARLVGVVAVTFLYPAVLVPLGYLVATAVVMAALLALYNPGRWLANVAVGAGFSLASYYVFHVLLGVYMPRGLFP